jgi:hypothetical protein
MNEEDRIMRDISSFEQNIKEITNDLSIVDRAKRYYEDAKYYLEKGDHLTAFGCINYAHGLIDAIIKNEDDK